MSQPSRSSDPTPGAPASREESPFVLTEDLLLARFQEKSLAAFLEAVLPARELTAIAPRLGLSPLPGKRLKTMRPTDHAVLLARTALEDSKPRKALLEAVSSKLPPPLLPAGSPLDEGTCELLLSLADRLRPELRLALVLSLLGDANTAARALDAVANGLLVAGAVSEKDAAEDEIARLRARLARADQRSERAEQASLADQRVIAERERSFRQRIEELQHQLSDLQEKLGAKNREFDELRAEWENLKGDLRVAFRRAARYKHALDQTKESTEREEWLLRELQKERQRADIEAAKLEILEYQLDLLEQVDQSEAETRVMRDNDPVPDRVLRFIERTGRPPRILVVGGAGKQRAHRDNDFADLKNRLGIEGEWRFADYTSWHRDLPRLRNDIRDRFDLVFVLHWNRTTFVQKMHDEARAANARVRTVPYRGFLSLERAVREEVDRYVQEKS